MIKDFPVMGIILGFLARLALLLAQVLSTGLLSQEACLPGYK
jgi:hypothetical protein